MSPPVNFAPRNSLAPLRKNNCVTNCSFCARAKFCCRARTACSRRSAARRRCRPPRHSRRRGDAPRGMGFSNRLRRAYPCAAIRREGPGRLRPRRARARRCVRLARYCIICAKHRRKPRTKRCGTPASRCHSLLRAAGCAGAGPRHGPQSRTGRPNLRRRRPPRHRQPAGAYLAARRHRPDSHLHGCPPAARMGSAARDESPAKSPRAWTPWRS